MIDCDNISFGYPGQSDLFENFSLRINSGESVSIMGANGSGKTTLARCLNGLLQPRIGEITIDGLAPQKLAGAGVKNAPVAMVFQNPDNQIVSTTIEREIAFGLENLQVPHDEMHDIVGRLLTDFGLLERKRHPPHKLSGGEKQLLALAAVLAMQPKYLILDEPTSLLDPHSRRSILRLIFAEGAFKSGNITPILITQYPEEALWTDRLLILHHGKIHMDDHPRRAFKQVDEIRQLGLSVPVEYMLEMELDLNDP